MNLWFSAEIEIDDVQREQEKKKPRHAFTLMRYGARGSHSFPTSGFNDLSESIQAERFKLSPHCFLDISLLLGEPHGRFQGVIGSANPDVREALHFLFCAESEFDSGILSATVKRALPVYRATLVLHPDHLLA